MRCQACVLGKKIKKNIIHLSSAELAKRVVKVKVRRYCLKTSLSAKFSKHD